MTNRTKDQVASSYMEQCKKKAPQNRLAPTESCVIVTGATGRCADPFNRGIGFDIAWHLTEHPTDKFGAAWCMDIQNSHEIEMWEHCLFVDAEAGSEYWMNAYKERTYAEATTLVLCNGETHLDWIENTDLNNASDIMHKCLIESISATVNFVKMTIDKPYRKSIIYIGSMAHSRVLNGSSVYCAAKAGLAHYARCAAWELAPKGFDVYIVHPSNVANAPMSQKTIEDLMRYRELTREEAIAYWSAGNPRNNPLQKKEIANLVYDLAIGKYPYLAGTQIDMAGGMR